MISDEIIKTLTAISPIVTIIISSIIAPVILKVMTNISNTVVGTESRKQKINLYDSGIFPTLKRLKTDIYKKEFVSPLKTAIARDLIFIKMDVSYKIFHEWVGINKDKIDAWSNMQLKAEIETLVSHIIKTYNEGWILAGIPKLVRKKFNKYHGVNEDIVFTMVDLTILNSWETQLEKTYSIFDGFCIAYNNAVFDIERVINPMNGALVNETYNGISGKIDFDIDNDNIKRKEIDKKYKDIFVKFSKETFSESLSDSQIRAIDDILTDSELEL